MVKEKKTKNTDSNLNEEIDMHLNKYQTSLKYIFKENKYYEIITDGMYIIELMLKFISTRENYSINEQTSISKQFTETDIIPITTKYTLLKIYKATDKINKEKVNYKNTHNLLKSFKKFFLWFNNSTDDTYDALENCIKIIEILPTSEPSKKDREYETNYINQINESLKNLEKHVELITEENYVGAVTEGYNVCNLMIELLLKNESYVLENGFVIRDNEAIPAITFCTQEDIFPEQCNEFLNILEEYKNDYFKFNNSYTLALSFLKGLCYFILWFDNFYSSEYSVEKPFKIKNCCIAIEKLMYISDNKILFNPKVSKTKKQKSEINSTGFQINFSNNQTDLILTQLGKIMDSIHEESEKTRNTVEKGNDKIMTTLDNIKKEIKNISLKITDYQSLIQRQIKNFDTDEERDMLISAFADVCAERIIKETSSFMEDDNYDSEKTNLINLFGESAWAKLSEESKTYLISSKLMFNNLNNMENVVEENIVDYSGVCILITKTLEVELYKRFFESFLKYLEKRRYKKYDHYPTGLLYKNKWPLNDDKFNLGTMAYILCLKHANNIDYYREQNNKEKLIEYCSSDLFNEDEPEKIERLIIKFGNEIEKIRQNYRNPSAHRNAITQKKANNCLNLVLYDDRLLIEMLDSFKK